MNFIMKQIFSVRILYIAVALLVLQFSVGAQEAASEEDFFRIMKVSSPEGTLLEVGGLCTLPNGDLTVQIGIHQFCQLTTL